MMQRSFTLSVIAIAISLLFGGAAIAQVELTPIPLPAKPDFSSMQYFRWHVELHRNERAAFHADVYDRPEQVLDGDQDGEPCYRLGPIPDDRNQSDHLRPRQYALGRCYDG